MRIDRNELNILTDLIELFHILTIYAFNLNEDKLFKEFSRELTKTTLKLSTFLLNDYLVYKNSFSSSRVEIIRQLDHFNEIMLEGVLSETDLSVETRKILNRAPEDMHPRLKLLLAFFDVDIIQDICNEAGHYDGEWIYDKIISELRYLETKLQPHINRMKADKNFITRTTFEDFDFISKPIPITKKIEDLTPTLSEELISDVLTDKWLNLEEICAKLNIKDPSDAIFVKTKLNILKRKDIASFKMIENKIFWKKLN